MWLLYAVASALFAGATSILAKCGIKRTDSNLATALRTGVVLICAWGMVFLTGAQTGLRSIDTHSLILLILSGLATGGSWLCYFRALSLGRVQDVVPIDKLSGVLTLLLAFLLLGEPVSWTKAIAVVFIALGTWLMIDFSAKPAADKPSDRRWLFYALASAVFAALTGILGKLGITGVDSNLGTAIRTGVVLIMAWIVVFITGAERGLRGLDRRELIFICLSGLATGGSWLCYYRALQDGPLSVVAPIDKLSILVTVAFSWVVFGERTSRRGLIGLAVLTGGTLLMLV